MNADTVNKKEDFIFIFLIAVITKRTGMFFVVIIFPLKKEESRIQAGATSMTSCLSRTVIIETDYPHH